MTIQQFNHLTTHQAKEELFKCCGSSVWAEKLANKIPFNSTEELKKESDKIWNDCSDEDALEAFKHHPKIGDIKSLEKKFASTKQWASGEQAGVNEASQNILQDLANGNEEYEKKFGYIFIVCATGKTATEMLALLQQRLPNSLDKEMKIAMHEQNKITDIRIDKLFS